MKKILIITAVLLASLIGKSQNFYKVLSAGIDKYSEDSGWENTKTEYPDNMYLIMKDSSIIVTNDNESKYVFYGDVVFKDYEEHTASYWKAYDNEGRNCNIMIRLLKNDSIHVFVSFIYKSHSYEYVISSQKQ